MALKYYFYSCFVFVYLCFMKLIFLTYRHHFIYSPLLNLISKNIQISNLSIKTHHYISYLLQTFNSAVGSEDEAWGITILEGVWNRGTVISIPALIAGVPFYHPISLHQGWRLLPKSHTHLGLILLSSS